MSGTSLSPRPITRTSFGVSNESSYPPRQLCVVLMIKTFHWEPHVCLPTALSSPTIRCSIVLGGWLVTEGGIVMQRRTVSVGACTIGVFLALSEFRKTVGSEYRRAFVPMIAVECGEGLRCSLPGSPRCGSRPFRDNVTGSGLRTLHFIA